MILYFVFIKNKIQAKKLWLYGLLIRKLKKIFPLAHSRAPQKLPNKEFELSELSEFSNSRLL